MAPEVASDLPRADVRLAIAESAAALEQSPTFPREVVERARAAARRLAATEIGPDDIRHAAVVLEAQASIDLQVPTRSRVPGVSLVKRVLKKLMVWYLRFLATQITALGQATARLGVTIANRIDGLEAEVHSLEERVVALERQQKSR